MSVIQWMTPRRAAVFHAVTTREELIDAFAEMYPAVWDALQEQGGPELGEVVAVYHSIGEDELVLSAGIEVEKDFSPQEPLALLELGGCESGMIDHFGPYLFADFRRTQSQPEDELAANGRTSSGMVIERYLTVPDAEPDQSKWQTEIWLPLS